MSTRSHATAVRASITTAAGYASILVASIFAAVTAAFTTAVASVAPISAFIAPISASNSLLGFVGAAHRAGLRVTDVLAGTGRRVGAALVYSSVFLGAVSACKVATACVLLGVAPNLSLAVGFLAPLGVYNLDKAADVDADAATYAGRAAFVRAAGPWFAVGSVAALLAALVVAASGGLAALAIASLPALATAVYTYPVLPGRGADRLKDVYLVNTGVVAGAWAIPVAALPAAFALDAHRPVDGSSVVFGGVAVVTGWFFLRTTIAAEARNVRDRVGDAAEGVRTLPVVHGVRRTRRLLYALDAASVAVVAIGVAVGAVPWFAVAAVLPAVALSLAVTNAVGRSGRDAAWCTYRDLEYPLTLLALLALRWLLPV